MHRVILNQGPPLLTRNFRVSCFASKSPVSEDAKFSRPAAERARGILAAVFLFPAPEAGASGREIFRVHISHHPGPNRGPIRDEPLGVRGRSVGASTYVKWERSFTLLRHLSGTVFHPVGPNRGGCPPWSRGRVRSLVPGEGPVPGPGNLKGVVS